MLHGKNYLLPVKKQVDKAVDLINNIANNLPEQAEALQKLITDLSSNREPIAS